MKQGENKKPVLSFLFVLAFVVFKAGAQTDYCRLGLDYYGRSYCTRDGCLAKFGFLVDESNLCSVSVAANSLGLLQLAFVPEQLVILALGEVYQPLGGLTVSCLGPDV
jgi:hypothetical protein